MIPRSTELRLAQTRRTIALGTLCTGKRTRTDCVRRNSYSPPAYSPSRARGRREYQMIRIRCSTKLSLNRRRSQSARTISSLPVQPTAVENESSMQWSERFILSFSFSLSWKQIKLINETSAARSLDYSLIITVGSKTEGIRFLERKSAFYVAFSPKVGAKGAFRAYVIKSRSREDVSPLVAIKPRVRRIAQAKLFQFLCAMSRSKIKIQISSD